MTAPTIAPALRAIAPRTAGVHHVSLRVTDLARARVFYIERLGFPILRETPTVFLFAAGATAIGVRGPAESTAAGDAFDPFRVGLDHVALACPDEDELRRIADGLTTAGIEHTGVKRDAVFGKAYVAFHDPDGIKWECYVG